MSGVDTSFIFLCSTVRRKLLGVPDNVVVIKSYEINEKQSWNSLHCVAKAQ